MATINFTNGTIIPASWLNDVDAEVYETSPAQGAAIAVLNGPAGAANVGYTPAGTGAVARTVQGKLRESVSVKDFGAVGDGVTNDAAACQAAITSVDTGTGGTVYFPKGTYLLGSTLTITNGGVHLVGASRPSTTLMASHSTGPVIRILNSYSHVHNMTVTATNARNIGAAGRNIGIWMEAPDLVDSSALRLWNCSIKNVRIISQPSHGLLVVGACYMGIFEQVDTSSNKGHGFAVDLGILTARVNVPPPPGVMTVTNCGGYDNGGHCFAAGHPDDTVVTPAVRVMLINFDCGRNATDAAVRYGLHEVWLRGSDHSVVGSAFNGQASSAVTTPTRGGIFVGGRAHSLRNNRFINVTRCVTVGNFAAGATEGVYVDGMRVIVSVGEPAPAPEVVIDAGAKLVRVRHPRNPLISSLITTAGMPGTEIDLIPQIIVKTANQTVTGSTTLVDDTDLKFFLDAVEKVHFQLFLIHVGNATADIKLSFSIPSGSVIRWGSTGGIRVDEEDTIVADALTVAGATAVAFGGSTSRRIINVSGYVRTVGTGGLLQLQWAQNTSDAVNTIVEGSTGRSALMIWRDGR